MKYHTSLRIHLFSGLIWALLVISWTALGCKTTSKVKISTADWTRTMDNKILFNNENHFAAIKQLTFGGDAAEAYWSKDNQYCVFQYTNKKAGIECDRIYKMDLVHGNTYRISNGKGRTTCSYFLQNGNIIYASTHEGGASCPHVPERRSDGKYVWPIYDTYDIYLANANGKQIGQLTHTPGYDAEATVSPQGDLIVFTSVRNGDLDLYTMKPDGSDVRQVTNTLGYDGGAFFTPDGKQLIFRASRPQTEEDINIYKNLLKEGLVMPTKMELFMCNVDGTNLRQITQLGGANWAPFMHPSGKKIIFASNHASKRGFPFDLYMINVDGTGLERITHDGTFSAFPVFSSDGKYLLFSSNRNSGDSHDTNLFIAEWVD